MEQFQNCSANIKSDSAKLAYLRSLVTDYAFSIITHLTINNANFKIAIDLLKAEFLDTELIVDEIFCQLINSNPKFDSDYNGVKQYLARIRADLYELNSSYNIDFITSNTPGNLLVSHIVFSKIPNLLKREIVRIYKNNYPSIKDIFDCYQDVIRSIVKTTNNYKKDFNQNKSFMKLKNKSVDSLQKNPTLENFITSTNKISIHCKFCMTDGHSMLNCKKFTNFNMRKKRCEELNVCTLCISNGHMTSDCSGNKNKLSFPCKFCKSRTHISAMCNTTNHKDDIHTNVCINAGIQENLYLLPIVSITVGHGKNKCSINCLLDTGSQRSYFSKNVLRELNYNVTNLSSTSYEVKTFVSTDVKVLNEVMLNINLNNNRILPLPILIKRFY